MHLKDDSKHRFVVEVGVLDSVSSKNMDGCNVNTVLALSVAAIELREKEIFPHFSFLCLVSWYNDIIEYYRRRAEIFTKIIKIYKFLSNYSGRASLNSMIFW